MPTVAANVTVHYAQTVATMSLGGPTEAESSLEDDDVLTVDDLEQELLRELVPAGAHGITCALELARHATRNMGVVGKAHDVAAGLQPDTPCVLDCYIATGGEHPLVVNGEHPLGVNGTHAWPSQPLQAQFLLKSTR